MGFQNGILRSVPSCVSKKGVNEFFDRVFVLQLFPPEPLISIFSAVQMSVRFSDVIFPKLRQRDVRVYFYRQRLSLIY